MIYTSLTVTDDTKKREWEKITTRTKHGAQSSVDNLQTTAISANSATAKAFELNIGADKRAYSLPRWLY